MAKLPDDVNENLKRLSEEVDVPMKELVKKMGNIIKTDEQIQGMKEREHKIRFAFAVLYREYSMTGGTTDVYMMPVSTPQSRAIKMKGENSYVGNVQALIKRIPSDDDDEVDVEDKWEYGAGTFWREGAKEAEETMERGKIYEAKLRLDESDWGVEISADKGPFKEIELEDDEMPPSIEEFYEEEIADRDIEINIGEIDINESEGDTDIRMFEGTVVDATIGERADGSTYGRYDIMDYSIVGSQLAVFCHPADIVWAQGSVLNFIGTIRIGKDKTHRWQNHFVIPKSGIPKDVEIPEPEKETVDIDADDENEEKEVEDEVKEDKKEEKPKKKSSKKSSKKKKKSKEEDEEEDGDIPIEF